MFINFFAVFVLVLVFNNTVSSEELSDVLYDAYNYYPDIAKSKKELEISGKDLKISKTDFLPSIDFSASKGKDISKTFPDTSNRNITTIDPSSFDIDITQPLSYSKVLNLKQSKNQYKIARLSFESTTQDVLLKASKSYYTVLKDFFLLDVSKKNEENLKKKLDATEKRFEFRDVTKTDVFQAKARLAEAISKRIEAENNLEISVSDFKKIVGRDPKINWFESNEKNIINSNPKDWSKFGIIPNTPKTLKEALKTSLENNPEYVTLKLQHLNSKLDITKNNLSFAPEFSLTGSVGKSLEPSRAIERKDNYSVTAEVTVPLFNKGHNFLNLSKSRDTAITNIKAIETKRLELTHQIKSSWKKISSTKASIESLEISVDSNIMAVEGVSREAGVGTRTTLNILDAEKELTQSESNLVNAQYQLIISSFELLRDCGILNFNYLGF